MEKYKICVVVPVFNRLELTKQFLQNFSRSTYKNYQIVIVNDGSTDSTGEFLAQNYPDVVVLNGEELWWTGGTNKGVEYALENNFDYVLTINQDAVVEPDYLAKFVACAGSRPNAIWGNVIVDEHTNKIWAFGVTPKWAYGVTKREPSHSIFQHNFWQRDLDEVLKEINEPYEVEALNGDGVLVPVDVYREIGLYDSKWMPQYHADTEFCMRAKKHGYKVYICSDARLKNEDVSTNAIKGWRQRIFNNRSALHWKPVFKLYWSYAPLHLKLFFFWIYISHFLGKLVRG